MYVKDLDNVARESYRILNSKGIMIISVTHPIKWALEQQKGNIKTDSYMGYLSETSISWCIAGSKKMDMNLLTRPFEVYVNTFTKFGFRLETVSEPAVTDEFVLKYPEFLSDRKTPYRLNLKFVKP